MKSEKDVREKIKELEKSYNHVLKDSLAVVGVNAPRALIQIEAKSKLRMLYYVIDEECPTYGYEK